MDTLTYQEYWAEIQSLREAVQEEWDRETDWNEHASDALWQALDTHQWVIYTYYNFQVLALSNNADAFDDYGPLDTSDPMWKAGMAYCAMERDVMDGLEEPE